MNFTSKVYKKYGKQVSVIPAVGQRWLTITSNKSDGWGILEITKIHPRNRNVDGRIKQMSNDFIMFDTTYGYPYRPTTNELFVEMTLNPLSAVSPQINLATGVLPDEAYIYLPGQDVPLKLDSKSKVKKTKQKKR